MATVAEAIANVEKIQHDVDVYLAVPVLNDRQGTYHKRFA